MENQFNLSTLFVLLKKWQRPLIFFVLLCTLAGGIATLVLPKMYFSSSTIVPANPQLTDKNFLYGTQRMELNSVYGLEEDLDRLLTTCKLDGNFNLLVDSFKLIEHYKISNSKKAKETASKTLQENTSIFKTENGAVKINIWDTDKNTAAALANAMVFLAEQRSSTTNQQVNAAYLQNLTQQLNLKYKKFDSLLNSGKSPEIIAMEKKSLLELMEQDTKTIDQLQSAISAKVPGLLVLEKAYPASVAGKPKLSFWLSLAFFSSLFFGIFLVVVLESIRKK